MANGRCYVHGGPTPIKHGLYSKAYGKGPSIAERTAQLKAAPELLDSRNHIAALIACFERVLEGMDKQSNLDLFTPDAVKSLAAVTDSATRAIERYHKQQVGYYISPDKLEIMQRQLAATIERYCKDCPRVQALADKIAALPVPT